MVSKKIFAGPRVRRLRQEMDLSQSALAERLNISASYLNLIERDQRPLTARLLLALAETCDLDLRELSGEQEAKLAAELTEVLADPLFERVGLTRAEILQAAEATPALTTAFLDLYRHYRNIQDEQPSKKPAAGIPAILSEQQDRFPIEEVRDYFHARHNFIQALDEKAEKLNATLKPADNLLAGLRDHLVRKHGVRVSILPMHAMTDSQRRFDRHNRRLFLSELLSGSSRIFQIAVQIALEEEADMLDDLIAVAGFRTRDAEKLCRIGLANYFAGAVMMPYGPFRSAAEHLRYDITLLSARFDASIEQVAHRLTTLQRPDMRGVPFFLLRLDNAGNVSKRFSASGFHFARFGGTCPRWRIHDAFASPGQTLVQPVELQDGAAYLTISRTLETMPSPWPDPPRKLAISLGCEISHASRIVYGDGLDLSAPQTMTPIGVTCRICERHNCTARAFPPRTRSLVIDASRKNLSAFEFG